MRFLAARRADDGFSLVEVVVALTIATGVFLSLALVTISGVRGTLLARQNQLAGDMVNQAIEKVRALDFADVAMVTGDSTLTGDPRIVSGKFNPGTGVAEPLVYASVGSLNPHMTTETHNSTTYQVWRYVTQPAGITTGTRRLTVVVTWTSQGKSHSQTSSTFVTATRRGLPLPRFLLQFSSPPPVDQTKSVGTTVAYGFRLKNYGARDAWNISASAGTWTYYVDTNKDGLLSAGEVTQLTDSDGNGKIDTGLINTNEEAFLLATATVPNTVGSTTSYTWTFTSAAQPTASSASQSKTAALTVSSTGSSCTPSCTLTTEYLHDQPGGSHTNTGSNTNNNGAADLGNGASKILGQAEFTTSNVLQAAAYNYSSNLGAGLGRYVRVGGVVASERRMDYVADWRQQMGAATTVKAGPAVANLYIACLSGSGPMTLNVSIGTANTSWSLNKFTSFATGSATLAVCDGTFRQLAVPVTIASAFTVAKNDMLVLRAAVPTGMTSDVRIGYDWAGAPSTVVLPL